MTQANLFEPQFPPDLKGLRLKVASLLLENRGRLLSSEQIAQRVGLRNSADVRHICTELVDTYKLPIIGDRTQRSGGYRFADSDEEFQEAQIPGLAQALTMFQRIRARLGERKFKAALIRLKVSEALGLAEEAGQ